MTLANNKLGMTECVSKQKHTSFFLCVFVRACVCERLLGLPYVFFFSILLKRTSMRHKDGGKLFPDFTIQHCPLSDIRML